MTSSPSKERQGPAVSVKTALRIRPMLRKEKATSEMVCLEKLSSTAVVLHPNCNPQQRSAMMSPSSTLVLQTLSSPANGETSSINTAHDIEYVFHQVWSPDDTQESVYWKVGHAVALESMRPLKTNVASASKNSISGAVKVKQQHLLVSMGLAGSGKTYTCFGNKVVGKHPSPSDGLLPRMVDSLFSQAKHHISSKNANFCLLMSVTAISDTQVTNLLDENIGANGTTAGGKERAKSSILRPNFLRKVSQSSESTKSSSAGGPASTRSASTPLDESEIVAAPMRTYKTVEQARQALQTALTHSKPTGKGTQAPHVLVQIQPAMQDRTSSKVRQKGGRMLVLDMASVRTPTTNSTPRRTRDAMVSRSDAQTAVLHCLQALKEGEKVPYRRHAVTQVLEPLLAKKRTVVAVTMGAAPGQTDYGALKTVLQDLQTLAPAGQTATTGIDDHENLESSEQSESQYSSRNSFDKPESSRSSFDKPRSSRIPTEIRMADSLAKEPSMSYSDSTLEDSENFDPPPLPPPVAPRYNGLSRGVSLTSCPSPRILASPQASAPPMSFDEHHYEPVDDLPVAQVVSISDDHRPPLQPSNNNNKSWEDKVRKPLHTSPIHPNSRKTGVGGAFIKTLVDTSSKIGGGLVDASSKFGGGLVDASSKIVGGRKSEHRQQDEESEKEMERLQNQVRQLQGANDTLTRNVERLECENEELHGTNEDLQNQVEDLRAELLEQQQKNLPSRGGPQRRLQAGLRSSSWDVSERRLETEPSEPISGRRVENLFDNPLFQHMAAINDSY